MTIRHIPYALMKARAELVLMVGDRIYDAGALGTPTQKAIPAKPFIVVNHGPDTYRSYDEARVVDRVIDVWFYGEPGDFTVVERGLREVKAALHDATGWYEDPETEVRTWLTSCRWQGGSSDLYDDVYRANTRYGTYRLIGNTP